MIIGTDRITCENSSGVAVQVLEEHLAELPNIAAGTGTGATTITAFAGGGQASATALTAAYNNVTVVATDGDSVKLPDAALGKHITVKNTDAAQVLAVFPASGDEINGLAANAAVGIPPGCERTFWGISTGAWRTGEALTSIAPTAQKGALVVKAADSAGDTVTTLTNASQAAARTYTIPDAGANASVLLTTGTATSTTVDTAELNTLADVTAGTVTASKALVVDSNKDLASLRDVTLRNLKTTGNVGAANAGTTAVEYGDGAYHRTVLTVNTTLPAIAGGANLGVGKLLYTFPAGAIIIDAAYMSIAITQTQGNITADTPDVGLGTVIASGAVAVLSGTATFEDILTGQTAADCNGTATVKTAIPTAAVPLIVEAGGAHTVHLNVADGWAASGDAAATLVGTVVLSWRFLN